MPLSGLFSVLKRPQSYATRIESLELGPGAGFNASRPELMLGKPESVGPDIGSTRVVSLGERGSVTFGGFYRSAADQWLGRERPITHEVVVDENVFRAQIEAGQAPLMNVKIGTRQDEWVDLGTRRAEVGGTRFPVDPAVFPDGFEPVLVRVTDGGSKEGLSGPGKAGADIGGVRAF